MNTLATVFVVDDDAAVRKSLRMMLKAAGHVVETFSSANEFLAIFNPEIEGCIILDVTMPGMDGPTLQEELNTRGSRLPIIFLTGQGTIPLTVHTLKAGAMDFLTKPVQGKELLACVKQALDKSAQLQNQAHEAKSRAAKLDELTPREKEVMMLVIEGHTSKQIAQRLGISYRTVEVYRTHVMEKTGSENILDLARIASFQAPH